jgi:hypothetical protein
MILNIIKKEGIKPLFPGYLIVLLSTIPSTGLYFYSYEQALKKLPGDDESIKKQFMSGVYAQFISSFVFTPRDVIKERLQIQRFQPRDINRYTGSIHALTTIYKEEGLFFGLYKGYFQTLWLWTLYGGIYLSCFTKLKSKMAELTKRDKSIDLPPHLILPCAMIAASFAAFITNPLDVLKLHFQVQRGSFFTLVGFFKTLPSVFSPSSWFRGALARVYWIAPRTGISFTIYEYMRSKFKAH